ncbi:hypothetical protein J3R83DRAFT_7154 [Lanmaoa asiatica]|nr:hypothetical protein J3R83DRAFT_7154 [Lanmaoa asiatica]
MGVVEPVRGPFTMSFLRDRLISVHFQRGVSLHTVFRYPPRDGHTHQPRQIYRSRHVDPRTDGGIPSSPPSNLVLPLTPPLPVHPEMGQPSCKHLLGGSSKSRPYPSRAGPAQPASNGDAAPATALFDTSPAPTPTSARPTHAPTVSLSAVRPASPSIHSPSTFRQNTAHSHSQSRQLLSAAVAGRVQVPSPPSQPPQSPSPSQPQQRQQQQQQQHKAEDDLFSLDFHAPPVSKPASPPELPTKDVKQDILSLFSAAPAPAAPAQSIQPSNAFGQFTSAQSSWDAFSAASHGHTSSQSQQPISMMGTTGTGLWGVSSGWNGPLPNTTPSANIWGAPAATTGTSAFTNTTDIWGGSAGNTTRTNNGLFAAQPAAASKKDDVFGDLWGDFK